MGILILAQIALSFCHTVFSSTGHFNDSPFPLLRLSTLNITLFVVFCCFYHHFKHKRVVSGISIMLLSSNLFLQSLLLAVALSIEMIQNCSTLPSF